MWAWTVRMLMPGKPHEERRVARLIARAGTASWWTARGATDALGTGVMTGTALACVAVLVVLVVYPSRGR